MTRAWQAREAKARFSAFIEATVNESPQIVTTHGVETAVLLPIAQWREMQKAEKGVPGVSGVRCGPLTPNRRPRS